MVTVRVTGLGERGWRRGGGGGGVCRRAWGEAWVGRGGGACRFVPPAREPGGSSPTSPPRPSPLFFFFPAGLHLICIFSPAASLLGCIYTFILHREGRALYKLKYNGGICVFFPPLWMPVFLRLEA